MGFKINDLVNNPDELIKHFLKANNSEDLSLSKQEAFLNQIETELGLKASKIDPSLVPMVNGAVKGMKNSLNKVQQKFLQSLKRSQDQELAKIKKISSLVIDKGVLKERSENFLGPYLSSSNDYIQTLIEASKPESNSLKILIY
jgi:beta-N-acetylglucosaminidase